MSVSEGIQAVGDLEIGRWVVRLGGLLLPVMSLVGTGSSTVGVIGESLDLPVAPKLV